jgi:hypothetical protein
MSADTVAMRSFNRRQSAAKPAMRATIRGESAPESELTNKLLNFAHSDRSRGFVRVVDELPNQLFEKLSDGRMTFEPLPAIKDEPPDEQTDAFRRVSLS